MLPAFCDSQINIYTAFHSSIGAKLGFCSSLDADFEQKYNDVAPCLLSVTVCLLSTEKLHYF
jgi:hypothetical protein